MSGIEPSNIYACRCNPPLSLMVSLSNHALRCCYLGVSGIVDVFFCPLLVLFMRIIRLNRALLSVYQHTGDDKNVRRYCSYRY
ncbi:hypothetical protein SAMN05443582_1011129 [Phyllobacterium sp. OV277]|nr:hypothetical protein SAMN05443582_1011129 [Phyllobacterium sp. OV277]